MSPGLAFDGSSIPSGSSSNHPVNASFAHFPLETLEAIFNYVRQSDLLNLALTCRFFHELATAQLYRRVGYVFSTLGSTAAKLSLDRFTAMLETLATSDYNYAEYIRQISFERAHLPDPGRGEAREFTADNGYTCGKFLNSLLLIVLKRVTGLESFKWDICMELSTSMFEAISKIQTLQNLHIRLPSGPLPFSSPYNTSLATSLAAVPPPPPGVPPPMDITGIVPTANQMSQIHHFHAHAHNHLHHHHHPQVNQALMPISQNPTKPPQNGKTWELFKPTRKKRDLSLFSGLRSLAVLDIDNLECIAELAQCVRSSVSSIRSLKLSISDRLAMKARGKSAVDYSDSDSISEADEWGINNPHMPPPPHPAFIDPIPVAGTTSASTTNAPDVRRARAAQESVLAQIFSFDEGASQEPFDQMLEEAILEVNQKVQTDSRLNSEEDEDRAFVHSLHQMALLLSGTVPHGPGASRRLKTLELIEKSTARYLERTDTKGGQKGTATTLTSAGSSQIPASVVESQNINQGFSLGVLSQYNIPAKFPNVPEQVAGTGISNSMEPKQGHSNVPVFGFLAASNKTDDSLSDIVDMEHPDDIEGTGEDQVFLDTGKDGGNDGDPVPITGHVFEDGAKDAKVAKGKGAVRELKDKATTADVDLKPKFDSVGEYIRIVHGLHLDSLSIHLIPVKPAVLCVAVDCFSLKHLSLLNVGPQRVWWAMLAKLHQVRPLQLTSIHTDNVTSTFLSFVNGLDHITELFMFECSSRSRVESFAPKTTVKIEDIRQQILNKHTKTLRRLVIRNDEDASWGLNSPTVRLLASKGSNLIELAIGLSSASYHTFMQNISGLKDLVALQIFYHHPDRCNSMLRELRSCVIDHILHFPYLRIEYVSMCYSAHGPLHNHVVRIIKPGRPGLEPEIQKRIAALGVGNHSLGKKKTSGMPTVDASTSMSSPTGQTPDDSDDAAEQAGRMGVFIKPVKMRDIVGVKMWQMEAWSVKL